MGTYVLTAEAVFKSKKSLPSGPAPEICLEEDQHRCMITREIVVKPGEATVLKVRTSVKARHP